MPLRVPQSRPDIVASFNVVLANAVIIWQGANSGVFLRCTGNALVSKVGIHVSTASGNVSVAVYAGTGVGRARVPGQRTATTGAVACPATGYAELALDVPVYVSDGDFLFMSCDNATASFLGSTGNASALSAGIAYVQGSAYPAPSNAGTLVASTFRIPQIVGVV